MAKSKSKGVAYWKKRVWTEFSKYIRLSYADEKGDVSCYTCGTVKKWKEMQAGHGFSGRGNSILFEELIVRPQDFGCNICNSGKLDVFTKRLREELGEETFEKLWQQKQEIRKFTVDELKDLYEYYTIKVNELLHDKGEYESTRG